MIAKRIIPCLDVRSGRVVKGVNFQGVRDVADPVEMARMYNADGADQCRRNIRRRYVMIKRHYALGYVSECKYKIKILNHQIYAAKSAADTHKKPFFESGATFQALIEHYFPAFTL